MVSSILLLETGLVQSRTRCDFIGSIHVNSIIAIVQVGVGEKEKIEQL